MTTLEATATSPLTPKTLATKPREHASDKLAAVILACWCGSQLITANILFPTGIQSTLIALKSPFGLFCLLALAFLGRNQIRVYRPFRFLTLFGALMVLMCLLRSTPDTTMALLYGLWTFGLLVLPYALGTERRLRLFLNISIVMLSIALSVAAVTSLLMDEALYGVTRLRYHFGFGHPNYVAQFFVALFLLAIVRAYLFRPRSVLTTIIIMCSAVLGSVMADSRSSLLFMLVFSFSVMYASRGAMRRVALALIPIFLLGMVIQANVFVLRAAEFDDVDVFASNRFSLWADSIELNFWSADPIELLTGPDQIKHPNTLNTSVDRLRIYTDEGQGSGRALGRYNIDNNYLDVLLFSGLLGLVACLGAWWSWFRVLAPGGAKTERNRRARVLARSIIAGLLMVGLVGPVFPVFGSPWLTVVTALAIGTSRLGFSQSDGEPSELASTPLRSHPQYTQGRVETRRWNPPGRIS